MAAVYTTPIMRKKKLANEEQLSVHFIAQP